MNNEVKVYKVLVAFEHDGLSYAEGEKYEFATEVAAQLPEGSVVEFDPASEPAPTEETPAAEVPGGVAPEGETPAAEIPATPEGGAEAPVGEQATAPAEPWAGNHTVGRE